MVAQLEAYAQEYGMSYAFVVSTNLYGPGDKFDEAHGHVLPSLVSKFHRAVRDDTPVEVWGAPGPDARLPVRGRRGARAPAHPRERHRRHQHGDRDLRDD